MQWLQIQQSSQGNFWLNFPRVAEKKGERSVKFQKRTIPASPWRNAGRMGITFIAFEARLPQCSTAGTAHLTAPWPALKKEIQGKEHQFEVPKHSIHADWSKRKEIISGLRNCCWDTETRGVEMDCGFKLQNSDFILPSSQGNACWDCWKYFKPHRLLKCFTISFNSYFEGLRFLYKASVFLQSPFSNHLWNNDFISV